MQDAAFRSLVDGLFTGEERPHFLHLDAEEIDSIEPIIETGR